MFSGNPVQTVRLCKAVYFCNLCHSMLTSHENCSTSWWPLSCSRWWGIRVWWEQHTTLTVYDFFGTLRCHWWRWQACGHYLRGVRHNLFSAQYLSTYHTAIMRHHTHTHWIITVRVTHVRPQCHLTHHGCHWSHGTHTHHGITHSHPPDTSGGFHLRAYAGCVACIRRR